MSSEARTGRAGHAGHANDTNPALHADHAAHDEQAFRHAYTKDRREILNRLKRIEGQARGLQRLVDGEAYCLDILQQLEALTAAADQVALLVLEDHIQGCLTHAIESGHGQPYVDEVMQVVRRTIGRRAPRGAAGADESGVPHGGTTALPDHQSRA